MFSSLCVLYYHFSVCHCSDSEDDVTGEDVCLVPSEEDSSDEELRCINDSEEKRNTACAAMTPSSDSLFALQRRENTEAGLLTESSQVTGRLYFPELFLHTGCMCA